MENQLGVENQHDTFPMCDLIGFKFSKTGKPSSPPGSPSETSRSTVIAKPFIEHLKRLIIRLPIRRWYASGDQMDAFLPHKKRSDLCVSSFCLNLFYRITITDAPGVGNILRTSFEYTTQDNHTLGIQHKLRSSLY